MQNTPTIIKRYSNRKLYDTSDSCYVTLEDIADMIRQGEDIQVIENNTKQDITSTTLAQIIFEEQKRNRSTLPQGTFRQLIQAGGESIKELVQKTLDGNGVKLDQVRGFYQDKIKPALETAPQIKELRNEIVVLQKRIASIERRFREQDNLPLQSPSKTKPMAKKNKK